MTDRHTFLPYMLAGPGKPVSVLLVEDNADDQYLFKKALGRIENVQLSAIAGNGVEALTILKRRKRFPDLIFTDINMPQMDGLELLQTLKADPLTSHIPVIAISLDVVKGIGMQAHGAKAFIKKEPRSADLSEKLERFIHPWFVRIKMKQVLNKEWKRLKLN